MHSTTRVALHHVGTPSPSHGKGGLPGISPTCNTLKEPLHTYRTVLTSHQNPPYIEDAGRPEHQIVEVLRTRQIGRRLQCPFHDATFGRPSAFECPA
eukprot:IDg973t1